MLNKWLWAELSATRNTQAEQILSVVTAAAIGRRCLAANKADIESSSSSSSSSSSRMRAKVQEWEQKFKN